MKIIDIILIALVVIVMLLIFYFSIWRHRNNPCCGCPYAKNCEDKKKKTCDTKQK